MQSYAHGLDVLGADDARVPVPVRPVVNVWHETLTIVGALASLATLWSVLVLSRRGRR